MTKACSKIFSIKFYHIPQSGYTFQKLEKEYREIDDWKRRRDKWLTALKCVHSKAVNSLQAGILKHVNLLATNGGYDPSMVLQAGVLTSSVCSLTTNGRYESYIVPMALIHSTEDFFMKYFNEEVYGKFFKYSKAVQWFSTLKAWWPT